ncbi:MAG TPA: hypothetical protein VKI44_28520 [Acetobacteraceae bacterium]|nr:hypothetical protein [Acetobacteraceae bacterium]
MISVINMIPNTWSDEANQDSEPCLSVNSSDPTQLIATAFTYDNPAGSSAVSPAMTGNWAPYYYSTDGGNTWTLEFMLPSGAGANLPTYDLPRSEHRGTLGSGRRNRRRVWFVRVQPPAAPRSRATAAPIWRDGRPFCRLAPRSLATDRSKPSV